MEFRTQKFEGPLELLLALVEEKKLTITDVALAEVTEQYLAYVQEHREEITLENLAGFLSMAARLILMKSKALLPFLVLDKEEEEEVVDLATQLAEYKKFAEAAQKLEQLWMRGRRSYARDLPPRKRQIVFTPPELTSEECGQLFRGVLAEIPTVDQLDQKRMQDIVALEERIMSLSRSLQERGTVAFSQFVAGAKDRTDVVVSFLALLELVKQNAVVVTQDAASDDITIAHNAGAAEPDSDEGNDE